MNDFNKNLILADTAFKFPEFIKENRDDELKMVNDYFKDSVFAEDSKMFPKFGEKLIGLCEMNNIDPQLMVNIILTQTSSLEKNPSLEEVFSCFSFQNSPDIGIILNMTARMLVRFFDTAIPGKKVKVMDDEEVYPANKATAALYQVIPFVGAEDLYVYERSADKEGNIIDVKKVLKSKAPFGMHKFWLNIKEYDMKGLEYIES